MRFECLRLMSFCHEHLCPQSTISVINPITHPDIKILYKIITKITTKK